MTFGAGRAGRDSPAEHSPPEVQGGAMLYAYTPAGGNSEVDALRLFLPLYTRPGPRRFTLAASLFSTT